MVVTLVTTIASFLAVVALAPTILGHHFIHSGQNHGLCYYPVLPSNFIDGFEMVVISKTVHPPYCSCGAEAGGSCRARNFVEDTG